MAAPKTASEPGKGSAEARQGKGLGRYVGLGISVLFFIALFGSILEFLQGGHRPNPYEAVEPGTSWLWWRYPLPEAATGLMPWPVGINGRFVARGAYDKTHGITITPGGTTAVLEGVGPVELVDFVPFQDGSAWALDRDGALYAKTPEEGWVPEEIRLPATTAPAPAEPRISGAQIFALESEAPFVWAALSPDGRVIVTLSAEKQLQGWAADTGEPLWRLRDDFGGRVSFHPTSNLSVIPVGFRALVLDWQNGEVLSVLEGGKGEFRAAVFAPDGRIVTWSEDAGLGIWEAKAGKRTDQLSAGAGRVEKIVFSPDGRFLAMLSSRGIAVVYDYRNRKEVGSTGNEKSPLQDLAFTSGGDALVVADRAGNVQVVEVGSFEVIQAERGMEVLHLATRNDTVLARLDRGDLGIWRYVEGSLSRKPFYGGLFAAALSPTGDLIAAQLDDDWTHVFGSGESDLSVVLDIGRPLAQRPIFSPDGSRLLLLERGGRARIYDVGLVDPQSKSGTELVAFEGRVTGLHFVNSLNGWLATDAGLLRATRNDDNTWQHRKVFPQASETAQTQQQQGKAPQGVAPRLTDVHFLSALTGWVAGEAGFLASTGDGGATWTEAETTTDQDLLAIHFATSNSGLAVGQAGTILQTTDGGGSWSLVQTGVTHDLHAVQLQDNNAGWIGGAASEDELPPVLQTIDNGETWEPVDYGELPAPLLLFLGIPLLALGGFLATYRKPQTLVEQGVDPAGATDKPIGWDDPDPLKFQPVAKGLSYFLRNQRTEPPLTIGINGPWGTGKSSLMNLVMEDLRQYGCSPVWFNAWHHQKEEHLLAALLENIRNQAVPHLWQRDGIMFRLRLLWLRTRGELKALGALAILLAGLFLAYETLVEGNGLGRIADITIAWVEKSTKQKAPGLETGTAENEPSGPTRAVRPEDPSATASEDGTDSQEESEPSGVKEDAAAFLLGPDGIWPWIAERLAFLGPFGMALLLAVWLMLRLRVLPSDPAKLIAGLRRRVSVRDLRDQLGFRHRFGNEFKQVCTALRSRHSPGLVILIDDLDRCQPGNVLEVLEAVNFLASVGDCFIILGMARRQVENCVAIGFKDFIVEGLDEEEHGLLQTGPSGHGPAADGQTAGAAEPAPFLTMAAAYGSEAENGVDSHATTDQRRFARRYLEKLINIEVAVPRGNPEHAAGLFTPDQSGNGMGKRLQRRQRLYTAAGLGQVLAIGLFLGMLASPLAPLFEPTPEPDAQGNEQVTPIVPEEVRSDPQPTTDPADPEAEPVAGPEPAPGANAARPVSIPPVLHAHLTVERPWWAWWGPSGLFVMVAALVAIRRRLRPAHTKVEDTKAFTKALKRWYPLIYAANPTPRGIKRFENRMRFLAMQAHPPFQAPDVIDRILDWVERTWASLISRWRARASEHQTAPAPGLTMGETATHGDADYQIDDDMLVALGTVEALDNPTIKDKDADAVSRLVVVKTGTLESLVAPGKPRDGNAYLKQLADLKAYISGSKPWQPSGRDLTDYRRLSGQIRG